jgi:outer membrane receptor protein involved in Fe transport
MPGLILEILVLVLLPGVKTEGIGTGYTDVVASVSGSEWRPAHYTTYINYNKSINSKLKFSALFNYKIHAIRNGSKIARLKSYANWGDLELKDLAHGVPASWLTTYYYEQSQQYRSEFKLLYNQSEYFYFISGIELRNSQLQGYYLTDTLSSIPQNTGTYPYAYLPGGNQYNVNDIGIYSQARYRIKKEFGFTAGLRFDYNQIRKGAGLGGQLSPRFVIDYSKPDLVLKAIISKGVQNVSNFTKFDDVIVEPNPSLTYESIYNYEFSLEKNIVSDLKADVDIFYSKIDNVIGTVLTAGVSKNMNIGEYKIKGIQSNLYYKPTNKKWQMTVNYTYTDPRKNK